jgi:5-methyltetrahydropteroyltriglutamate--homocysteine methyltransferase
MAEHQVARSFPAHSLRKRSISINYSREVRSMTIPTEPIGSIPRPPELLEGIQKFGAGRLSQQELDALYDAAIVDTIQKFEATGSPVISDGEQKKGSFATYPVEGLENLAADGAAIPFADGHVRQLPRLTAGPFRYKTYAAEYLTAAKRHAHVPVKQAVISASALSLLYPASGIEGYSRDAFIEDLVDENEADIRRCLQSGAYNVQIDFTEGRLAVKLDPTKGVLKSFIDLNNQVLDRFSAAERKNIGVHTCPGGDQDSTHSADVDYAELLPSLFQLKAGNFYVQLASEKEPARVLKIIKESSSPDQRIFVGVIDPINPKVETPEEVRDRVLEAAEYIPLSQLGTTDDCGFSPFSDDTSTARETAFAKIRARVTGTALAAKQLRV